MSFSLDRQEFSAMIRQARTALLSLNRAANQELAASAVESAADGPSVESERHRSSQSDNVINSENDKIKKQKVNGA